jgi:GxxExxY protein
MHIKPHTELKYIELTDKIVSAFYKVHSELGFGFMEKVYENALFMELRSMGIFCIKQKPIQVYYNTQVVGEYFANIVVNDTIVIELKTVESTEPQDELELINCLRASEMEVGLLLNFGRTPQFKRMVIQREHKKALTA